MNLKDVVLDVEAIVSRCRIAAYNDKTGKPLGAYMEEAVHEALAVAGYRAVKPSGADTEPEARPMLSAAELAMERATKPAQAEGVRS